MITTLASLYSPSSVEELPWEEEPKQRFREFVHEIMFHAKQSVYLLLGKEGSGKSLLLRSLLIPECLSLVHPVHDVGEFQKSNVLSLHPWKVPSSSLFTSIQLLIQRTSAFPYKKIILFDDVDFANSSEWQSLLSLLQQTQQRTKVAFVFAARSPDLLPECVVRTARCLTLPLPQFSPRVAAYFQRIQETVGSDATNPIPWETWWKEGNGTYSFLYQRLDVWYMCQGKDGLASFGMQTDSAILQEIIEAWQTNDPEKATRLLQTKFIDRGFSIHDVIAMIWKQLQQTSMADDCIRKLVLFHPSYLSTYHSETIAHLSSWMTTR